MPIVTFRIEKEDKDRLYRFAKKHKMYVSEVIREAINCLYAREKRALPKAQTLQ